MAAMHRILVTNLPAAICEIDLKNMCSPMGRVASCRIHCSALMGITSCYAHVDIKPGPNFVEELNNLNGAMVESNRVAVQLSHLSLKSRIGHSMRGGLNKIFKALNINGHDIVQHSNSDDAVTKSQMKTKIAEKKASKKITQRRSLNWALETESQPPARYDPTRHDCQKKYDMSDSSSDEDDDTSLHAVELNRNSNVFGKSAYVDTGRLFDDKPSTFKFGFSTDMFGLATDAQTVTAIDGDDQQSTLLRDSELPVSNRQPRSMTDQQEEDQQWLALQISRSTKTFFFRSLDDFQLKDELIRLRSKTLNEMLSEWQENRELYRKGYLNYRKQCGRGLESINDEGGVLATVPTLGK